MSHDRRRPARPSPASVLRKNEDYPQPFGWRGRELSPTWGTVMTWACATLLVVVVAWLWS